MDQTVVELSSITVPTPEPYDDKDPDRQRENLAYVALQVIAQMQAHSMTVSAAMLNGDLVQALEDLQYQGVVLEAQGVQLFVTRKNGSEVLS